MVHGYCLNGHRQNWCWLHRISEQWWAVVFVCSNVHNSYVFPIIWAYFLLLVFALNMKATICSNGWLQRVHFPCCHCFEQSSNWKCNDVYHKEITWDVRWFDVLMSGPQPIVLSTEVFTTSGAKLIQSSPLSKLSKTGEWMKPICCVKNK